MDRLTPLQKASPAFRRILFEGKITSLRPSSAITAQSFSKLNHLVQLMSQHNVGCIPLLKPDGSLDGIISERDIVNHFHEYDTIKDQPGTGLMTRQVQTLPHYGSVARALYFMVAGGYRHLPITGMPLPKNKGGAHLSMVSIKNIAAYLNTTLGCKITGASDVSDLGDDLVQLFSSPLLSLHPQQALSLPGSSSVGDAVSLMRERHAGSILVKHEDGRVAGIFTERDLICKILAQDLCAATTPISAAMTPRPHTMTGGSSLALALEAFASGKYRHLPVVDDDEKLLGVVSLKDFIRALTAEVLRELGA